jgi:hypothetical protein
MKRNEIFFQNETLYAREFATLYPIESNGAKYTARLTNLSSLFTNKKI